VVRRRVTTTDEGTKEPSDRALLGLLHAIAAGDHLDVSRRLDSSPGLARHPLRTGASRDDADTFFLTAIGHYVYRGDTALHIAAAAHQRDTVTSVIARGAPIRARNRRGAEPLHYAADGRPGAPSWDPAAQGDVIACLIGAGADPDAGDNSGVAALHRAVRRRSSAAVGALIENGADPRLMNKHGSTPLHLAVQNTGASDSGSDAAKVEQGLIIGVLLRHGARPTDVDARGKTVVEAATSDWIRHLLTTS
jgi:ankyrin repeat protein